jgi:hypothetical protein
VNYLLALNSSSSAKEKSRSLLLGSPIHSDADATHVSNLLKALGLVSEANSVLTQRGLFWLHKSLRLSSDSVALLYRKGGMETKALSFFINGLDSRRARSLIDFSLRRCLVSLTQSSPSSPHLLASLFHLRYLSVDEILPLFPESLQESSPASEALLLHSHVISDPTVEVNISSGLICAIDETIGVPLCGVEGVSLRYYVEACQSLLSLFHSAGTSSDSQSYEQILRELRLLSDTAIPLRYLIGPSQAPISSDAARPPPPAISCLLSCPQRYWLHLLDLILLVDRLYNLKYEALEEILTQGSYSPSEYDSLLSQYNALVIILFDKREIETLLQMLHHCHTLYLQQDNRHTSSSSTTTRGITAAHDLESVMTGLSHPSLSPCLTLSEFHPLLLAMYQSSIYVLNYEQYDERRRRSQTGAGARNRNTFTLFHLKSLRSSLNMSKDPSPSSSLPPPPASSGGEGREERKTTLLKLTVPELSNRNTVAGAGVRAGAHSVSTKTNQFLTVAPSSLSYRIMS